MRLTSNLLRPGTRMTAAEYKRKTAPHEDAEQIAFVERWEATYPQWPILHIPNGGKRGKREAALFKKMGVKPGVPDLQVVPLSLWVEMKRTVGGVVSPAQAQWHADLRGWGHTVIVGYGADDAWTQAEAFVHAFIAAAAATLQLNYLPKEPNP
tara:strand:- start:454 stop:912 length:459 start_codon:yes stop_codon:yes gene_type:complete